MNLIDRRQFIIMDKPYECEDFSSINLRNGMILSYHKDLKVRKKGDIILLGHAFSVKTHEIELNDDVLNEKRYWAGRWILVYKDRLYMDACGTLGCCYGYSETGCLYVSSSLHLLNLILKRKDISNYKVKYGDGNGMMDYYPIPYTPLEGIKKLLPSQYIDFSIDSIQVLDNIMVRRYKDRSRQWIKDTLIQEMSVGLRNIAEEFPGEVWIPLTGGVDSRTIFAIANHSGIKFNTYTALRDNLKKWDKDYPVKICKKCNKKHYYIDDTKNTVDTEMRKQIFDAHCGGYIVGTERQQFLAGSDIPIKKNAVVLWGTIWAVYIKSYYKVLKQTGRVTEKLEELNSVCGGIVERSNVHKKSLESWLQYIEKNPITDFDWRERLYFEQRNGSWVSGAFQAIDLFDSVRIAPVNCQELLELLFSLDVKPGDKGVQVEIINKCCPELKSIPYGEPSDILYRAIRKIKKLLKLNRS